MTTTVALVLGNQLTVNPRNNLGVHLIGIKVLDLFVSSATYRIGIFLKVVTASEDSKLIRNAVVFHRSVCNAVMLLDFVCHWLFIGHGWLDRLASKQH